MLNPKLKEVFTDERVIKVLDGFAASCQQQNIRIGIMETAREFDVTVPGMFIYYGNNEPSDLFFNKYIDELFNVIDDDAESTAGGLIHISLIGESRVKEIIDLWV